LKTRHAPQAQRTSTSSAQPTPAQRSPGAWPASPALAFPRSARRHFATGLGGDSEMAAGNPLIEYFDNNPGRMMLKWQHYLDIYHRHLQRFRGTPCTIVEFGVYHGGSLQMWRHYFGEQCRVIGVDINPRLQSLGEPGIEILIGDQGDRSFLRQLAARVGPIDILIDDGGHTMQQQIATLEELYGAVKVDGVIIVEDTHTSYWREYGGGLRAPMTFMEFAKRLVDELNAWHSRDPQSFAPGGFTRQTQSMHFYDSVVVIEKGPHPQPVQISSGTPSFPIETPVTE
jgi:cephalosporin hydroxylase